MVEAGGRLRLSVRWLLLPWAALLLLSIALPLLTGAATSGLLGFVPLLLLAALLVLVTWLLARLWPRGRFRVLNFLRGLLVFVLAAATVGLYALGARSLVSFLGDCGELPIPDRYVCVIVCDGANLMQARDLLMEGLKDETMYSTAISSNFPNISRYFIRQGAFTANGISIWPSSSVPAHTGIMTGCYPRHTGVMGQRQFDPEHGRYTSYIGLGISMLGKVLAREVRTLPEYFPQVRSLVVLQIANRGASLYVPTPPHDEQVLTRVCQVIEATDFLSRYTGRNEIPRIVVMTLPEIDHVTHNMPFDTLASREVYLKQDEYVGRLIDLYRAKGIYEKTLFVLCSDHGMEGVDNHLTIDNLFHDLRFEVYQSLKWTLVPQWGSFEANFWRGRRNLFRDRYNVVSLWGGNSDALIYVRGQRCGPDGTVAGGGWRLRPSEQSLHAYAVGGATVDVIRRLLDYSPGIGLVLTNPERGVFTIYARSGTGQIRERERDGVLEFQYAVLDGDDPLRYASNPAIARHLEQGSWLSDAQWAELTYLQHYPDALRRIAYSFENPNSGDMHIVAADGWDFAPYYVAKHVLSGSHGSLNLNASLVPIMFHGPGVRVGELPYGRNVDIVPTILTYLGVKPSGVDGRPLPIFADDATNDAVLTAARSVFAEGPVGSGDERYTLEHSYGSYDRCIVRIRASTGEREVLVPSVRAAFAPLGAQPNLSLELVGTRAGAMVLRELFMGEHRSGREVFFDPRSRAFSFSPPVPPPSPRVPVSPAPN